MNPNQQISRIAAMMHTDIADSSPSDSEKGQRSASGERRRRHLPLTRAALGAVLTTLFGLALLCMPIGEKWADASYDCLFRFSSRTPTNKLALILMDNAAHNALGQTAMNWDRALHAELLNKLKDAGCPLVVFDVHFRVPRDDVTDSALA